MTGHIPDKYTPPEDSHAPGEEMPMSDFAAIFDFIKNHDDWSIPSIQAILAGMAKSSLSPLEEDQLLRLLHKKSGMSLTSLRREFAQMKLEHGIPPTDLGIVLAQKVLETQFEKGRFLIWVEGMGFFQYNLTHFQALNINALRKRIVPIVAPFKGHFENRSVASVVSEVLTCLRDLVDLHEPNDTPKNVINTTSREIWLKDDGKYELSPHKPDSRLFGELPYGYDPKAQSTLYTQTMLEMFAKCSKPDDVVRHWNEFLGYVIQPDRFVDAVWFMIGSGANGKSTALKILLTLLGRNFHSCDIRDFGKDNFKYRALLNKLLLVDEDYKKGWVINDAFLKKVSGNGMIGGRSPHKLDGLFFQNTAAPLLIGNHYPVCTDTTHGWVRRLNVFPFDRQFEKHEIDVERFNKIAATEMPGILNDALAGYARLCQRGHKFLVPNDCKKAAEKFLEQSNVLLLYVKSCFEQEQKSHIRLSTIRHDMSLWGQIQGITVQVPGHGLKGELENLGYCVGEMDGHNSVKGYRLKATADSH